MGDEDGSQELPQRSRGAARGGADRSAQAVSPVLSEELRQRMQAAVKAERAEAAANEGSDAPERPGRQTLSAPADRGAAAPAVNGTGGARKRDRRERQHDDQREAAPQQRRHFAPPLVGTTAKLIFTNPLGSRCAHCDWPLRAAM